MWCVLCNVEYNVHILHVFISYNVRLTSSATHLHETSTSIFFISVWFPSIWYNPFNSLNLCCICSQWLVKLSMHIGSVNLYPCSSSWISVFPACPAPTNCCVSNQLNANFNLLLIVFRILLKFLRLFLYSICSFAAHSRCALCFTDTDSTLCPLQIINRRSQLIYTSVIMHSQYSQERTWLPDFDIWICGFTFEPILNYYSHNTRLDVSICLFVASRLVSYQTSTTGFSDTRCIVQALLCVLCCDWWTCASIINVLYTITLIKCALCDSVSTSSS